MKKNMKKPEESLDKQLARIPDVKLQEILAKIPEKDRGYAITQYSASFSDVLNLRKQVDDLTNILINRLSVFDNLHSGFVMEDKEGIIVYANPFFADLLGYTSKDIVGGKTIDLIVEEGRPEYEMQTMNREKGKNSYQIPFLKNKKKLGEEEDEFIKTLVCASPSYNNEGVYQGNFAIIFPINEIESSIHAVIKNSIGDWFNSPLTVISGNAQLLMNLNPEDSNYAAQVQERAEKIEKTIETMSRRIFLFNDPNKLKITTPIDKLPTYIIPETDK